MTAKRNLETDANDKREVHPFRTLDDAALARVLGALRSDDDPWPIPPPPPPPP